MNEEKEKKEEISEDKTGSLEQKQHLELNENNEVTELKEKLKLKEKEVDMYKEQALRAIADLSNFTKKAKESMDDFTKYANAELIGKLLPVIDSFEIALKSIKEQHTNASNNNAKDNSNFKHFYSGMELIHKDIVNVLKKEGLKHQDVIGRKFDPLLYEVVGSVEVDDGEENIILEEVRKGYTLNDKVIRYAMVKISKIKEKDNING